MASADAGAPPPGAGDPPKTPGDGASNEGFPPSGRSGDPPGGEAAAVFVFNGDADGLCAQHILFLELGAPVLRVTGLKRDIELLDRVPLLPGVHVHALDISLKRNLGALPRLLGQGNMHVTWYDHHEPGEPGRHPRLSLRVNQAPETCTAAIVDAAFGRRHPLWAAMAAFGDGMPATGSGLASAGGASAHEAQALRRAGVLLNYNAYGEQPGDQLIPAADLALRMETYDSALDFCWDASVFAPLAGQFEADRDAFQALTALVDLPGAKAYVVPEAPFARRYAATWANERAEERPGEALAVLNALPGGAYRISLRAPRGAGRVPPASGLAAEFGGGGRNLAAGIDALPAADLERFAMRFGDYFGT